MAQFARRAAFGAVFAILVVAADVRAETWHVRVDGGTRAQCTGKADAPYPGSGVAQNCALKHPFYLFTTDPAPTQNGEAPRWIIAGGDTVVIHGGEYRIGYKSNGWDGYWNFTGCRGDWYNCYNPVIPAGTAANPTRIVGEQWATGCSAKPKLTGGIGVTAVVNLKGAKNVAVECLELSDFAQCGSGSLGAADECVRSGFPISDYAARGISVDPATDGVLLRNLYIHGLAQAGILGRMGGTITADRIRIAGIQGAGWDGDDGSGVFNRGALIIRNSLIEWSGCLEEYPMRSSLPYYRCFDQDHGGYGDGLGFQAGEGMRVDIDRSVFRYNVQDGVDLLYVQGTTPTATITHSSAYANGGQQWKIGAFKYIRFANNLTTSNCRRLAEPVTGLPPTYRDGFSNFCRALDGIGVALANHTVVDWFNNTTVGYNSVVHDLVCVTANTCVNTQFNYVNNIFRGYVNPAINRTPSVFYYIGIDPNRLWANSKRTSNMYCGGRRNFTIGSTEIFLDVCPGNWLMQEPAFSNETALDRLDLRLSANSPAIDRGEVVGAVVDDFEGAPRYSAAAPDIGAYEVSTIVFYATTRPDLIASGGKMYLTWPHVRSALTYQVQRRSTATSRYVGYTTVTTNSYVDSQVIPGRTYCYRVRAAGADSTANWGAESCLLAVP